MIPVRKLRRMPADTALRHAVRRLEMYEQSAQSDSAVRLYLAELLDWLVEVLPGELAGRMELERCRRLITPHREPEHDTSRPEAVLVRRQLNTARHVLQAHLGMEPAEWDFPLPESTSEDSGASTVSRSPLCHLDLYLDGIRSPFNLGSIIRSTAALGARRLLLSPDTVDPEHQRARRSAMGCSVPLQRLGYSELIAGGRPLVALETGGSDIRDYHPPSGEWVLIIGSEELGIHPVLLQAARDRISIPLYGPKASLNVGVATGAALYAIMAALSQARG